MLKAASVWAEPGKVTTLMGRNGSGKTTLMRVAVGNLRPDHGVVSFMGVPAPSASLSRLARRGVMFIPQGGLGAPAFSVRDHFDALASAFGRGGTDEALSIAGLRDLMDQRLGDLSGGERTRVSLALAIARRPDALVADEPLMGLSPRHQEELGGLLRTMASRGTAVVASGHDAAALLDISDAIVWSVAGTTHHLGSPAAALAHSQFQREYLGPGFDSGGRTVEGPE